MCAGNTREEAITQGISEILERHVQNEIMTKHYSLPDVPDYMLSRYPSIKSRMSKLAEIDGYRFIMKDCSLGGKYPVAALVIIEENKGYYGVKFGAHPNFGIAMERTLTEATQGLSVTEYAKKSILNFANDIVDDQYNRSNTFKDGHGQFPFELFMSEPSIPFTPVKEFLEETDEQLLKYCIDKIIGNEFEVLVRDRSVLGFPSYQVIIPGVSEMNIIDIHKLNNLVLKSQVERMLQDVKLINKDNVQYLTQTLLFFSKDSLSNSIRCLHGKLPDTPNFKGEELQLGWLYLLVISYFMKRDYKNALSSMKMLTQMDIRNSPNEKYYLALLYYLSGMVELDNHDKVITYLKQFFDQNTLKKIDRIFSSPDLVFVREFEDFKETNQDYQKYMILVDLIKSKQL